MLLQGYARILKNITMADITVSEYSGFCFGVKRAVDMINKSLEGSEKPIFCLGELIHNRLFNETLIERGVRFIKPSDIDTLPNDALVFLRAHGTVKQIIDKLDEKGIEYIDATCPYVSKIHKIVASQPESTKIIVIGDEKHPEVEGIMSWAKGEHIVFADKAHIDAVSSRSKRLIPARNGKSARPVLRNYIPRFVSMKRYAVLPKTAKRKLANWHR